MIRIGHFIVVALMLAVVVVASLWARHRAGGERCRVVDVEITNADSSAFVTREGVRDQLNRLGIKTVGKAMADINTDVIEQALAASEYVEQAQCVKCPGGRLLVRATQIVPVMRVFDGDVSYYVNRSGKQVAATAVYHADVPLVEGHFTKEYPATRLLPLLDAVERDGDLRTLPAMYAMQDSNNVMLVPRINGHIINVGDMSNLDNKLAKLKLFYAKVMPEKGWMTYDTISLKWDHRVVATRRAKAVKVKIDYNEEDDEPIDDLQTMSIDAVADTSRTKQDNNNSAR